VKIFKKSNHEGFTSPITGSLMSLSEVPDAVFSQGMMGAGFAISIEESIVSAPVSGKVVSVFPTGHAYIIEGFNGMNVLIHIGIDTVNITDGLFKIMVNQGDIVKQKDVLVEVDVNALKLANVSLICPIIFLEKQEVTMSKTGRVSRDEELKIKFG